MGKTSKILVCGHSGGGKTAMLETLIYNTHDTTESTALPTTEDTYVAMIETDRGVKEKVRIYELGGCNVSPQTPPDKHLITCADAVIIVYDVTNKESFITAERLKRDIDRSRDRRELTVVACGNKLDLQGERRAVDFNDVTKWAQKEKIKTFETSITNRQSLIEAFVYTASKITQPPSKSTFFSKKSTGLSQP